MIFDYKIDGIPAQIRVVEYFPGCPASFDMPGEPDEVSFEVLDRKGYAAPWLSRKLTSGDHAQIERIALEKIRERQFDPPLVDDKEW